MCYLYISLKHNITMKFHICLVFILKRNTHITCNTDILSIIQVVRHNYLTLLSKCNKTKIKHFI